MEHAQLLNDYSTFTTTMGQHHRLFLQVDGIRCAKCVFQIESILSEQPNVQAKLNMSTRRLQLEWDGTVSRGYELVKKIFDLGYTARPFDVTRASAGEADHEKFLLRCMTVSGFATGNMMLLSFALWSTTTAEMGEATRSLLHWVGALIALPTVLYSGRPFYQSALDALKNLRTNMDVPISVALLLTSGISVFELLHKGEHAYFDSVVMLVFLLLIGRYLDQRVRGKAKAAAQDLLQLLTGTAQQVMPDGRVQPIPISQIQAGMLLQVAVGEKIPADGTVETGHTQVDSSMLTGETAYQDIAQGQAVLGGMMNVAAPMTVRASKATEDSLLAEVVRLMEKAEQGHAHYVRLADRIARYYTPAVHVLALGTFLGWIFVGIAWQEALLIAATVLIITCPCALGLAVPVVQVAASTKLFRKGILLKSGDALEKMSKVDTIVFDKTGTLTLGQPQLTRVGEISPTVLAFAAAMARQSRHPLAKALAAYDAGGFSDLQATEVPAQGMTATYQGKTIQLGSRKFCGDANAPADAQMELWLRTEGEAPHRFVFEDQLRPDARAVCLQLMREGYQLHMLSGDRAEVAQSVAQQLDIHHVQAPVSPVDKSQFITMLQGQGRQVLMVGDGLNDAAALASALVSMSPSTAIDMTQNAADVVFQGQKLGAVLFALKVAKRAQKLVRENFILSMLYNVLAVPLAVLGHVTPLIAAVAMSASSIAVVLNAQRLFGIQMPEDYMSTPQKKSGA